MILPLTALLALLIPTFSAVPQQAPQGAENERWPLLLEGLASFGGAVDGHWLYVYGGHVGRAHAHSRENLNASFRRLNLLDRATWEELPMERAVQSAALVAHDGFLYRVGGMEARNVTAADDEQLFSTAEFHRYDPLRRAWEPLTPLPEPRSSHDAVVHGDKLYVLGGWRLNGDEEPQWHDTAWTIDLVDPAAGWRPLPPPPFHRRALAVAAHSGRIFAIGGITAEGQTSREVAVLDLEDDGWSQAAALPGNGFGASAFALHDAVYCSGMDGVLYRLEGPYAPWEPVRELCFPRFFHRLLPLTAERLIAVGGANPAGHLRSIEIIQARSCPRESLVHRWSVPFPGATKNRQGMFLNGSELILFGGNVSLGQHDFEPRHFSNEAWSVSLPGLSVSRVSDAPVHRQSFLTHVPRAATPAGGGFHGEAAGGGAGYGYAVGGFGHDGEVARSHDELWRFDFNEDEWRKLETRLLRPRTQFQLAEHEGRLWVFGGLDYDPRRGDGPASEEAFGYAMEVDSWSLEDGEPFTPAGIRLPRPRRAFGGAQVGDRYYLIGGMREDFELLEECDVFDFATQSWETMPAPSVPRISPEVAVVDGRIFLAGGSSPKPGGGFAANPTVEVFDPQTGSWELFLAAMPLPPRHARMLPYRGRLLFVSTHTEEPHTLQLALVEPAATERPQATVSSLGVGR